MNTLSINTFAGLSGKLLKPARIGSALLAAMLVLAGCSVAPTYERATVNTSVAFKEASDAQAASDWKTAQPAEELARGEWWKIFNDDGLNALENQALEANQNLKAAARLSQSRALRQDASTSLFPQVNGGFGATRQRPSPASQNLAPDTNTTPSSLWRAQIGVSYKADLFGRVASTVDAAKRCFNRCVWRCKPTSHSNISCCANSMPNRICTAAQSNYARNR